MKLPDFIIGGAPRSGTTWIYSVLDLHPSVYLAKPTRPEPKFFLLDDSFAKGLEYYSKQWFSSCAHGKIAGEKSTNYLESALVSKRIAESLPGVKLLFVLREPASRAYSNYLWSRMNGLETEDFIRAIEIEEHRQQNIAPHLHYARPHAYFSRGLYAEMLLPYFEKFPREQILCMKYEDISGKPREFISQVHRFLEIEIRPNDADEVGVVNAVKAGKQEVLSPEVERMLRERYAPHNRKLAELLGDQFEVWYQ